MLQFSSPTPVHICSGNPVTFALGFGLGFGIVGNCNYVVVSFFSPCLPVCPTLMMPVIITYANDPVLGLHCPPLLPKRRCLYIYMKEENRIPYGNKWTS
ncbi:uncharacterized protein B0T23DRAFT_147936 [Neurospora hispaniola]|uniref:Uncharacterized protein n=1 Tax=Neurospora hispaniola TaxID=588809 RepID=A0AAJ0I839_9PEZI|nr:hypothetical protein B0T23DRAFT_147936 [Neurospora hispaniola]